MLKEGKNLKDSETNLDIVVKDNSYFITYTKTNKLITALYMVTDIMDKEEPIRNKLRTLGTAVISDINSLTRNARSKISEIMSFLDIASAVNIVSEMNYNILKKEFSELDQSIKESLGEIKNNKQIDLTELLKEDLNSLSNSPLPREGDREGISIGHPSSTRIGVQKGGTLMKALSGIKMSSNLINKQNTKPKPNTDNFDLLKKQRQNEISSFLQKNGGSASITDIKNGVFGSLISCSEKTLQRELVSMVKNGVLKKTGEKRWSRYFLARKVF